MPLKIPREVKTEGIGPATIPLQNDEAKNALVAVGSEPLDMCDKAKLITPAEMHPTLRPKVASSPIHPAIKPPTPPPAIVPHQILNAIKASFLIDNTQILDKNSPVG